MTENPLHHLMKPSSIALFGAGNNFMKMGTMQALSIVKDGYQGQILPVHPKEKTVMGFKAYASVADLPMTPDLGFLVVPSDQVPPIMEALGQKGTKSAIVITAGFGETGEKGIKLQEELNRISKEYNIRYLGPNCMGIINSEICLNTTVMPYTYAKGALGFASQSGTYVTQTIPYLGRRGIRFSKAISLGNSASIDLIDALEYLGQDKQTRAIALYIESIKDVRRFVETARKITPHKPVVAQYVGGSEAGARSAMSHTGSLAAPDPLYQGLFRQAGVIRVDSIEALYELGNMLAQTPDLCGPRIGIVTNSGGPGSAMANVLEKEGLAVPQFSPALQAEISQLIPEHAPCGNPVDLTFHLDFETLTQKIPGIILDSGEVDGLIIHGAVRKGYFVEVYKHIQDYLGNMSLDQLLSDYQPIPDKSLTLAKEYGKPVVISSFFGRDDDYTVAYRDHGMPVFNGPEKAALGMAALYQHSQIRQAPAWQPPDVPDPPQQACDLITTALDKGQSSLDECHAKLLLKAWGVPTVEEILAHEKDQALAAAQTLGFPLAMKACAPDILHKSGHGLIKLNVKSVDEAAQAWDEIQAARGQEVPVLVSPMVNGQRELVAGITACEGFGPSVMFGIGGILTEALNDVVFRPAPVSVDDAAQMIEDIRSRKLLGPVRGMPAVNTQALAGLLSRLSLIPLAHPQISEIDINPLIVQGGDPVAVDALVVLNPPEDSGDKS